MHHFLMKTVCLGKFLFSSFGTKYYLISNCEVLDQEYNLKELFNLFEFWQAGKHSKKKLTLTFLMLAGFASLK